MPPCAVEDGDRMQHRELQVGGIAAGREIAKHRLDRRMRGDERLRVPQQLKSAQTVHRFEFAICVFFQPAHRAHRFTGGVHDVDFSVPHPAFAGHRLAAAHRPEHVVEPGRVAQIEECVVNLQHTVDIDDRDGLGQALGEAELVAPGAQPALSAGPPQGQRGALRRHAQLAVPQDCRQIRIAHPVIELGAAVRGSGRHIPIDSPAQLFCTSRQVLQSEPP